MHMKKTTCIFFLVLSIVICMCTTACGNSEEVKEKPAEIGKWHADYKLSDMDSSGMADEDKALFSMLAGNTVMGIDVEFCEDGSFTYDINTDEIEKAVSKSVSTFTSWFFDYDVSIFTDRLVEAALQDVMSSSKNNYLGDYTKSDDGIITAVDGDKLIFKIKANRLIQIDDNGDEVITFTKADNSIE